MKTITYQTVGTCARFIELTGEDGKIVDVKFFGGCNGNLQGISKLVKGMKYEDVKGLFYDFSILTVTSGNTGWRSECVGEFFRKG